MFVAEEVHVLYQLPGLYRIQVSEDRPPISGLQLAALVFYWIRAQRQQSLHNKKYTAGAGYGNMNPRCEPEAAAAETIPV